MIDLQLSSLFINQLLTMGLPAVDQSLMKLLEAMETFPKSAVLFNAVSIAKTLGLLLALCMGSYECWMMMLGRRGMDVMKLLRIAALSICITTSSYICSALKAPGKGLETTAMMMAQAKNREVAALELKVAEKQAGYLKRLREVQDSIETAKQVQAIGEDAHWWDKLIYNMENLGSTINNYAQRAAVAAETKVSEWINDVIRFIGELIFQMSYYGMLVAQRIFLTIMATFAPIMFALSIVPPWSNAWSQWISKYLSLSLWGFVVYMCLYYIDFILMYNLRADIKAYESLLQGTGVPTSSASCPKWLHGSSPVELAPVLERQPVLRQQLSYRVESATASVPPRLQSVQPPLSPQVARALPLPWQVRHSSPVVMAVVSSHKPHVPSCRRLVSEPPTSVVRIQSVV